MKLKKPTGKLKTLFINSLVTVKFKEDSFFYIFYQSCKNFFWAFIVLIGMPAVLIYLLNRWFG